MNYKENNPSNPNQKPNMSRREIVGQAITMIGGISFVMSIAGLIGNLMSFERERRRLLKGSSIQDIERAKDKIVETICRENYQGIQSQLGLNLNCQTIYQAVQPESPETKETLRELNNKAATEALVEVGVGFTGLAIMSRRSLLGIQGSKSEKKK